MLLAQLAYDLEWRGVPCHVRLPGKRDELPVLDFPGGVTGVIRVGVRKESNGWLYTWKDRSVSADAAASDLILSAVS
ncbi:hypothetical protein FDA94_06050 [Herbidospora galbida]|uniref:Uncharacterized protein n=1 Tax=Herbidospora galbida TaxID=2575442 RepID=A0A4U3MM20_9ACTN|nr:hypothetical protein [Herbidospora galbida]TKK90551.1 hypothetical protein FDA94_06050 [Herbidospora galbida]